MGPGDFLLLTAQILAVDFADSQQMAADNADQVLHNQVFSVHFH